MENLILTIDGSIATITLNRPEKLNALDENLFSALDKTIDILENKEEVRCVIISGSKDKAFAAGGDIGVIESLTTVESYNYSRKAQGIIQKITHSNKVYIAAVSGYALGGGFELALGCDLIYATEDAKFGFPEVKLGILPGFGGTQRLPRLIGKSKAKEIMFTGKIISAQEAKEASIVLDIKPTKDELLQHINSIANAIAENAPLAVALAKRAIEEGLNLSEEEALKYESTLFGITVSTEDAKEGLKAFLDKRKPVFKNR